MNGKQSSQPMINERISYPQVQLIAHDGENMGVVSRDEALKIARNADLDLVIIADRGGEGYPVAKVMDYGKMLYEKKKQQSEARKKQHVIQVKEVKLRSKIADHDYQTKMRNAIRFLKEGNKLKLTLMFRGREIGMKEELAPTLFNRIEETLRQADFGDKTLASEKDSKGGPFWSRIYYLKKS